MPKGKGNVGVRTASRATSDSGRRTFVVVVVLAAMVAAGTIGLWASGALWPDARGVRRDAGGLQRDETGRDANRLEKPPRPQFELPTDASSTQRLVSLLREESFEVAERLVDALPGNPDALHLLGNVHQRHRNEAAAVQLWQECLRLDPKFADAHSSLGRLAFAKGDYKTAENHLRQALKFDPSLASVPLPLAEALLNQAEFAEAVVVLESFLANHPTSIEGWSCLGHAYQQLQDYRNAKRSHLQAISIDAHYVDAYHGAATALQALGEAEEAAEYFKEFRRLESQRPRTYRERDDPDYGDEQRMRMTVTDIYVWAGEVYAQHGQFQAAEEHWKRAAEFDANQIESRQRLAELYLRQDRLEEALRIAKELRDLQADNATAWLQVGVMYLRTRQWEPAEAALRQAIELAPEHAETYAILAQVQMPSDRNPPEAVDLARRAVELAPTAGHYYILATAWWNAGDLVRARGALQQAMQLDPHNPRYREAYTYLQNEP